MNQKHITIDQFNELTEPQKEYLQKWWTEPQMGNLFVIPRFQNSKYVILGNSENPENIYCNRGVFPKEWCYPLLSGWDMLMFLRNNDIEFYNSYFRVDSEEKLLENLWIDFKIAINDRIINEDKEIIQED